MWHIDGLVQERCNSSAIAMELHVPCTNPLKYECDVKHVNILLFIVKKVRELIP